MDGPFGIPPLPYKDLCLTFLEWHVTLPHTCQNVTMTAIALELLPLINVGFKSRWSNKQRDHLGKLHYCTYP